MDICQADSGIFRLKTLFRITHVSWWEMTFIDCQLK